MAEKRKNRIEEKIFQCEEQLRTLEYMKKHSHNYSKYEKKLQKTIDELRKKLARPERANHGLKTISIIRT